MKKRLFRIFGLGIILFFLLSGFYLYLAYEDYTCHRCMTIPSINTAKAEKSLVAIYGCLNDELKGTLYLTQGSVHGGGYHYYSDTYYVGYSGKLDKRIVEIGSNIFMASVIDGTFSGLRGINEIPKQIFCEDSTGNAIYTFNLLKSYPKNIELGSKKSYLKEWKTIIESY
jgi:hypothetical protein